MVSIKAELSGKAQQDSRQRKQLSTVAFGGAANMVLGIFFHGTECIYTFLKKLSPRQFLDLGGPQDWSLPYWNYCDALNPSLSPAQQQQALEMPPEFGTGTGANSNFPGLWIANRNNYTLNQANANPRQAMQEAFFHQ